MERGGLVPRVGSKHFSYGPKGMKQAQSFAKKIGASIKYKKPTIKKGKHG